MKKQNNSKSKNKTNKNIIKIDASKVKGEVWSIQELIGTKTFDEWMKIIQEKVDRFKKYRTELTNKITPQKVLEIIQLEEDIGLTLGKIEIYYGLQFYADTKNSEALAKMGQLKQISTQISNDMMFFDLWFMHLDDKIAKNILEFDGLKQYKYHLADIIKSKKHTKSEEIEQMLHIKDMTGSEGYSELYNIITNNYAFKWKGKDITKEELTNFYRSENPKDREQSYELMLTKYGDESTVLTELYKNIVLDWCNDGIKIRGYPSSINIRNESYDVTDKSVEVLLKVIRKNAGIFSEYFKIKYEMNKKAGQKYAYSRYHLYAPFITKTKKKYDYETSKKYVLETYAKFDKRFYDRAKQIFDAKHVHSHPSSSKRGGAFCMNVSTTITPYILLNHTDGIRDMFTMMHELGHGIHDIFSGEKQSNMEQHASLTICETASVFSEMILSERLLSETKDNEEKKYILTQALDNQYATIIRQAYFVIFELAAHEKTLQGVTKEELDNKYYELLQEQFQGMQIPECFKHEWNYIPHIHESPFYCYSYAWGNLLVLALYDMYRKEGSKFIEKYIGLLSAGGSDSPINLMKKLGIDGESEEFWQRGFNIIKQEIEELKKLK